MRICAVDLGASINGNCPPPGLRADHESQPTVAIVREGLEYNRGVVDAGNDPLAQPCESRIGENSDAPVGKAIVMLREPEVGRVSGQLRHGLRAKTAVIGGKPDDLRAIAEQDPSGANGESSKASKSAAAASRCPSSSLSVR
jgi:hypothetical protein